MPCWHCGAAGSCEHGLSDFAPLEPPTAKKEVLLTANAAENRKIMALYKPKNGENGGLAFGNRKRGGTGGGQYRITKKPT